MSSLKICFKWSDCSAACIQMLQIESLQAHVHLHLIVRADHLNNVFWSCPATVWDLSAQSLALYSEITVNCRSLAINVSYLLNYSSINSVQLFFFHVRMVTYTDEHKEQATFSGTNCSLQLTDLCCLNSLVL